MSKTKKLPEPTSLKDMSDQVMAEKVSTLLAEGMTQADIQRNLGWSYSKLSRLLDKYPEIVRGVHDDVRKRAVLMRHRNLTRLEEIRDQNENYNAAVRAADAIDSRAGMNFDKKEGGVTVQIFGQHVNVAEASGADLRAIAMEMAAKLGPEAEKMIEAEFTLERAPESAPQEKPKADPQDAGSR